MQLCVARKPNHHIV